jgi:hypothetical protein
MPRPRRTNCSPCAALGLALCLPLLAVPLLESGPPISGCADEVADADAQEDPLRGLWMRYETRGEGDPLRFWYFHGNGKGLYRYGKVGLANTHSFDYSVSGHGDRVELSLRFRKSGEEHPIAAVIEHEPGGRAWLTLHDDPREPGARYYKVESDLDFAALAQPQTEPQTQPQTEPQTEPQTPESSAEAGIGDRIWIDYQRHATGGAEFHMYQLAETAIDGRGVGWFHRGDFDNWSTESLTYRLDGERLELFFDIREEPNSTVFHVVEGERGRELVLDEDPRDFWARHRYLDGGRSFGGAAFAVVVGLQRWLGEGGSVERE